MKKPGKNVQNRGARRLTAAVSLILLLSSWLPAETARTLPQFKLRLLSGQVVETRHLRGKVTVIDFWAVWCKPCIAEIGDYNSFYRDYRGKGVRFIALASDSGSEDDVREAVRRLKIEYPVAAPSLEELDSVGEIYAYPTTWIVDASGAVVKEIIGVPATKHETLRSTVDRLLKEARKSKP